MILSSLKNIGKVVLILFLTTFIPFFLLTFLSNDPAEVALRVQEITPTEQNVRQKRHELGLDAPFFTRYIHWVEKALKGEFGTSYATGKSVSKMIVQAFPYTLFLTVITLLFIFITCLVLGILAASFYNHWIERFFRILTFVLNAIPSFWLAILLISFFSVELNWFPTGGYTGLLSVVLPALTLSLVYVAYYQVRGFSQKKITKHLLKNSIRSSIVSFSVSIPKLIAGSVIIESVFAWPGMGFLCITAIHNRDLPVLQAYIVIMSLFFIVSSLLIDSLTKRIDPRLKERVN